jgi:transposase
MKRRYHSRACSKELHNETGCADRVKILLWDTSGLVLIWKQLQQNSFRWPPIMNGVMRLSPVEFAALFDGLDWTRVQTVRGIHKPTVAA